MYGSVDNAEESRKDEVDIWDGGKIHLNSILIIFLIDQKKMGRKQEDKKERRGTEESGNYRKNKERK